MIIQIKYNIMIKQTQLNEFIQKIPPAPEVLKETIRLLNIGELAKAASVAKQDLALKSYLKDIVNKPIYGFKNEVSEIGQIFGILGVSLSQQTVYNYMISLLNPSKWVLFDLNEKIFLDFQASLSTKWGKILSHLHVEDKEALASISLLPSSIIITEALFSKHIQEVKLLRDVKALDYNTILKRLCNLGLFDICETIATKWEMDEKISQIIQASSGLNPSEDESINKLAKWMHLLLFYELSQTRYVKAGLNDFLDFKIDFVSDIYEDFALLMEIS